MRISIVIPAHNEEKRIINTLKRYGDFYGKLKREHVLSTEFIIVLNGCTDATVDVINRIKRGYTDYLINIIELKESGKGLAITAGFKDALTRDNDLIGFVDADMSTSPGCFYELVQQSGLADGIIASRYMPGARVVPTRPKVKRYGSKFLYEPLIWLLFGMRYYDYQCGAKLFKRVVLEKVVSRLTVRQWAFDVELLYLCKKFEYIIKEIPTIWHDKPDSKLKMVSGGLHMIGSLFIIRMRHLFGK
ncbi:glycosyltransferase [Candidatus Dependentiae bacterium]|nr:glycosyltransferase [Candidatus Dependentiae bacterium]